MKKKPCDEFFTKGFSPPPGCVELQSGVMEAQMVLTAKLLSPPQLKDLFDSNDQNKPRLELSVSKSHIKLTMIKTLSPKLLSSI